MQYITIDYLLQDREWWVARRFAFGGEVRVGRWARLPFLIETTVSDYSVNPVEPGLTRDAAEADGWLSESSIGTASEESGAEPDTLITMVPPPRLAGYDRASPRPGHACRRDRPSTPGPSSRKSRRGLEGQSSPMWPSPTGPRLGLGAGSWRFNRVEGLSAGAAMTVPVTARGECHPDGEDRESPTGSRGARHGSAGRRTNRPCALAAYRRLAAGSDFDDPLDLSSSVKALFTGNDRGQFYDAYGAELGLGWTRPGREGDVRVFVEEHRARRRGDQLPPPQAVHQGERPPPTSARRRVGSGGSPPPSGGAGAPIPPVSRRGGRWPGRPRPVPSSTSAPPSRSGTSLPTVAHIAGALEVSAGTSWNGPARPAPVLSRRRKHAAGIPRVGAGGRGVLVRAGRAGHGLAGPPPSGPSGTRGGRPEGRNSASTTPGRALDWVRPLLDGVVRLDLARGVRRGDRWRAYLYLDGVL